MVYNNPIYGGNAVNKNFELDMQLTAESETILDLTLSQVLLHNNSLFPWVILVPRRPKLIEIIDLEPKERTLLMEEISLVSDVMMKIFSPDKLNVAALGNIVPQLHIHIIARYKSDPAWPNPVFGRDIKKYDKMDQQKIIETIKNEITRQL